jgi:hypothetical protein
MKTIKFLFVVTAFALCASCANNNQDSSGMDSASVSTNPAMGGSTDTGITSSDSTDIRMPMAMEVLQPGKAMIHPVINNYIKILSEILIAAY